jgi:Xaa-Pro dipeptidase
MNRQRASELMRARGIDGLIATSTENFVYATEYLGVYIPRKTLRSRFFAVIPSDDQQIGMLCPRIKLYYAAQVPDLPVKDVRGYGEAKRAVAPSSELTIEDKRLMELETKAGSENAGAFDVLVDILRDRGLAKGARLAVDEMGLSHADWDQLQSLLPGVELVDGYDLFRDIRLIKTPSEVARLQDGLRKTHIALADAMSMIRPGVVQRDVWHVLREGLYKQGLIPLSLSVGIGPSSAYSFTEPLAYVAKPGDLVKFDPNALWRGYFADTGRTAVVGEPSAKQLRCFNAVRAGFDAGVASLKPGMSFKDVHHTMRDAAREAGLPHYTPSSLGHSIGVEIYDGPAFTNDEEAVVAPGMVLNVELPYYELGFGGIQIEDTVHVTEHGIVPLADLTRELTILA